MKATMRNTIIVTEYHTVEFWEAVLAKARKMKKSGYQDIANTICRQWVGSEPYCLKLCMWTCGLCCCIPCVFNHVKEADVRNRHIQIIRAWRWVGLNKVRNFIPLLEKLVGVIKQYPDVLSELDAAIILEGASLDNKGFSDILEGIADEDANILLACAYITSFPRCTLYPYHKTSIKMAIASAVKNYVDNEQK